MRKLKHWNTFAISTLSSSLNRRWNPCKATERFSHNRRTHFSNPPALSQWCPGRRGMLLSSISPPICYLEISSENSKVTPRWLRDDSDTNSTDLLVPKMCDSHVYTKIRLSSHQPITACIYHIDDETTQQHTADFPLWAKTREQKGSNEIFCGFF